MGNIFGVGGEYDKKKTLLYEQGSYLVRNKSF